MAQSVDYKLTENEERNCKKAQVPNSMYTGVLKLVHVIGKTVMKHQRG